MRALRGFCLCLWGPGELPLFLTNPNAQVPGIVNRREVWPCAIQSHFFKQFGEDPEVDEKAYNQIRRGEQKQASKAPESVWTHIPEGLEAFIMQTCNGHVSNDPCEVDFEHES